MDPKSKDWCHHKKKKEHRESERKSPPEDRGKDQRNVATDQGTPKIAGHPPEGKTEAQNRLFLRVPRGTTMLTP